MNKSLYLLLLSALFVFSAFGQEKLTLKKAIDIALEKNYTIISSQYQSQTSHNNLSAALGALLPSVGVNGSLGRSESYYPQTYFNPAGSSANTSVSASVGANITIFDGFANTSTYAAAKNTAKSSDYNLERTKQMTILSVEQAYYTVLRNEELLKVAQDNLKSSQRQLDRIVESNKVGASAKADVYRQQVATGNDELAVIRAQSNYDNSKNDLLYMLTLDVTDNYTIEDITISNHPEGIDTSYQAEMKNYDALIAEALQTRPDYQASLLNKDLKENALTIARSGYYPTLSANGSYGLSGDGFSTLADTKTWRWGLTLSIPVFSGFSTSTNVQSKILDLQLSEEYVNQTKRQVQKEIQSALLSLETAKKSFDVASKSVTSATEDRKIAEERYNLGANTLLDLLTARANYTQALSNRVSAYYDFLYAKEQFKVVLGKENY